MPKETYAKFYPDNWRGGTEMMTYDEKGRYIDLLMIQRLIYPRHIPAERFELICGGSQEVRSKFIVDGDGCYYNERMEKESGSAQKQPRRAKDTEEVGWRADFETYLADCTQAYEALRANREWIAERERYHPNLDVGLSVEKAFKEFWGTEAGWAHKKKSVRKGGVIDWKRTFTNALDIRGNMVYKSPDRRQFGRQEVTREQGHEQTARVIKMMAEGKI